MREPSCFVCGTVAVHSRTGDGGWACGNGGKCGSRCAVICPKGTPNRVLNGLFTYAPYAILLADNESTRREKRRDLHTVYSGLVATLDHRGEVIEVEVLT